MVALNIFHVLIAIAMVALVLVQKGAGATAGAAFGSGASGTVFGARGAGNFLTKSTWVLATLFCSISLVMAVVVSRNEAAPASDLGVVAPASAPASGQAEDSTGDTPLPPSVSSAEDNPQGDLPPLQIEQSPAADAPAAEDIPPLGGASADSAETAEGVDATVGGSEDS